MVPLGATPTHVCVAITTGKERRKRRVTSELLSSLHSVSLGCIA